MVVLSNGRGLVQSKPQCLLCGLRGGLKVLCDHDVCQAKRKDETQDVWFHVTCARQAGLEVGLEEREEYYFYGKLSVASCSMVVLERHSPLLSFNCQSDVIAMEAMLST
jgi:hypothetical protein